ncbi:MAG: hypothetical protein IPP07_06135 [Holophagales bacterium]|nr:hypothetical protein [Holophagales bacterium]
MKWDLQAEALLPLGIQALARLSYFDRPSFEAAVLLLDARLGTRLLEGNLVEIYVEGANLGDVRYEEVPGVPLPGRTLGAGLHFAW